MNISGKAGVFRLSPELAGKEAVEGTLKKDSKMDQTMGGLTTLSEEDQRRMNNLNVQYNKKFSFPFIMSVRKCQKSEVIQALEKRIENPHELEIFNAMKEVEKYSLYRLLDIIKVKARL